MEDAAAITSLLDGDTETVELVRAWIRATFTPYRTRLAGDLEDLEQEVLLHLIHALRDDRFRGGSRLKTYVRTFSHHKCIDRLRALGRRSWVGIDELELASPSPSALEGLAQEESTELALRVVEEVGESCRELWQMLQQGLSYREMSRRLGVAEGTLRVRVLRCRQRALEVRSRLLAADRGG